MPGLLPVPILLLRLTVATLPPPLLPAIDSSSWLDDSPANGDSGAIALEGMVDSLFFPVREASDDVAVPGLLPPLLLLTPIDFLLVPPFFFVTLP